MSLRIMRSTPLAWNTMPIRRAETCTREARTSLVS
jgi:hypothetical protein